MQQKIIQIIIKIVIALGAFLAGWFIRGNKDRKRTSKEIKKAIIDVQKEQAKVVSTFKKEKEEQVKELNKVINQLKSIIDGILNLMNEIKSTQGLSPSVKKMISKLHSKLDLYMKELNVIMGK